jgi:hypothetical protein
MGKLQPLIETGSIPASRTLSDPAIPRKADVLSNRSAVAINVPTGS